MYYNFYNKFITNGTMGFIPFVKIAFSESDKTYTWNDRIDKLDNLSEVFYGTPYMGKLILMANPEFGCNEYDIPSNSTLRIPYPLKSGIQRYIDSVNKL